LPKDSPVKDVFNKLKAIDDPTIISRLHYLTLHCVYELDKDCDRKRESAIHKHIRDLYFTSFPGRVTLTYGDVAESHKGMQNIGEMAQNGFTLEDMERAADYFNSRGYQTRIIHLNKYLPDDDEFDKKEDQKRLHDAKTLPEFQAYVFIARKGLEALTPFGKDGKTEIATEVLLYPWDSKLYNDRRKIVQNKNARHNLNFSDESQVSDFENGKGTTIAWRDVPLVYDIKNKLVEVFGDNARNLQCEGNKYYDPKKTGIGYHGDSERKKVIGLRLGATKMNLHYMWYYKSRPRGYNISMFLEPGDIYCMSEKTVGTDWKKSSFYTLRHAAGAPNYTVNTPNVIVTPNKKSDDPDIILGNIKYKE
jgi:hypothetical protein